MRITIYIYILYIYIYIYIYIPNHIIKLLLINRFLNIDNYLINIFAKCSVTF